MTTDARHTPRGATANTRVDWLRDEAAQTEADMQRLIGILARLRKPWGVR